MYELVESKWFSLPQIIRYIFIGCLNALVAYVVFCLLVFLFGESNRQVCLAVQWILTSFFSFYTQRVFVFRSCGKIVNEYCKCCSAWFLGYFINAVTLELFMKLFRNVYIAQFTAIAVTAVVTYILLKYWALVKCKNNNN